MVRLVDRRTDRWAGASASVRAAGAHAALHPCGGDHPQRAGPALRRRAPARPADAGSLPGNGAFTLYEDDGHSFEYEHGQFSTTSYTLRRAEDRLVFEIGEHEGAYVPPTRQLLIRVHAVGEQAAEGH